ncbi:MAG: VOC family protein [Actinobacteria bacterium]|nr:VOC family protein [Actinomycetota bacterium]
MRQRVDFVTLRVEDLEAATRYYVDGLGWQPLLQVPGEVSFFQIGHGQVLSLFAAAGFDADSGGVPATPVTLAHNVDSADAVRAVVDQMVQAGGRTLKAPQPASWGGFHALVQDPSGFGWEIAHNPGWSVAADGTVSLGPAGE